MYGRLCFSKDLWRQNFVTLAWRRELKCYYANRRNNGARTVELGARAESDLDFVFLCWSRAEPECQFFKN